MVRLGVSGSTILSESDRIHELAWQGTDHIEAGELRSPADLEALLSLCRGHGRSLGFHSPLYRGGSKYDLISAVEQSPEVAWQQLEDELRIAQDNDVEYVLVHFPYFQTASVPNPVSQIEAGLERISLLQDRYATKVLCEPKLGDNRDPGSIAILSGYSPARWREFGVSMCWDMGDNLLAATSTRACVEQLHRWRTEIDIIHVHNVKVTDEKYYWIPIHPSFEEQTEHFTLEPLLVAARDMDATLVWEHTPHFEDSREFVMAGVEWARGILGQGEAA
jgi:sugar phosphate isomerase/epimerase